MWTLSDRTLTFERPLVMGIVNVTPDSFSDGGRFLAPEDAVAQALRLVDEGADLLDIGGESSRPGSLPVPLDEELRRVLPVVEALASRVAVPLSIDTTKAAVARRGLTAGAQIINDITALRGDPDLGPVISEMGAGVILMHMRGTPATMQQEPQYEDVVSSVGDFFEERLHVADELGIARSAVVLDPGIGFGKTDAHNWTLLAGLEKLGRFGRPICLGVSRKGLLGRLLDRTVEQRLAGSLAIACDALVRRTAQILRVHDVAQTRDVVKVVEALRTGGQSPCEIDGSASTR
jgi:dihydropteroate synthase